MFPKNCPIETYTKKGKCKSFSLNLKKESKKERKKETGQGIIHYLNQQNTSISLCMGLIMLNSSVIWALLGAALGLLPNLFGLFCFCSKSSSGTSYRTSGTFLFFRNWKHAVQMAEKHFSPSVYFH